MRERKFEMIKKEYKPAFNIIALSDQGLNSTIGAAVCDYVMQVPNELANEVIDGKNYCLCESGHKTWEYRVSYAKEFVLQMNVGNNRMCSLRINPIEKNQIEELSDGKKLQIGTFIAKISPVAPIESTDYATDIYFCYSIGVIHDEKVLIQSIYADDELIEVAKCALNLENIFEEKINFNN